VKYTWRRANLMTGRMPKNRRIWLVLDGGFGRSREGWGRLLSNSTRSFHITHLRIPPTPLQRYKKLHPIPVTILLLPSTNTNSINLQIKPSWDPAVIHSRLFPLPIIPLVLPKLACRLLLANQFNPIPCHLIVDANISMMSILDLEQVPSFSMWFAPPNRTSTSSSGTSVALD
jgi:hypothetical protein